MKNLLHTGLFAASLATSSVASAAFVDSPATSTRPGHRAERLDDSWEQEEARLAKTPQRHKRGPEERREKSHQDHRRGMPPKHSRYR